MPRTKTTDGKHRTPRALVLAAHGSRVAPSVNAELRAWARELEQSIDYDTVTAAFHQGEPAFATVLDALGVRDVTVVPAMTSEGYYCDEVLPRELARNACYPHLRVRITRPVGTHPDVARLLARRLKELAAPGRVLLAKASGEGPATTDSSAACRGAASHGPMHKASQEAAAEGPRFDPRRTTLAIIGHGTERHGRSREATVQLAETLEARGVCAEVIPAFLDEQPGVETILQRAGHATVVVIPFLIGGGPHATRDIPARLGLEVDNDVSVPGLWRLAHRTILLDRSIGEDPGILEVIAKLAEPEQQENSSSPSQYSGPPPASAQSNGPSPVSPRSYGGAAPAGAMAIPVRRRPPLRLGTRASRLALWQAEHVAGLLRARGLAVEIVKLATSGDRNLHEAIADLASRAPFTDDIERALAGGEIDMAVHSLKDLPLDPAEHLVIAAILPRGDPGESLVSADGRLLSELPAGALIGTSSPRRAAQLRALQPDLRPSPIRGPVDDRLRQVRSGAFHAAVFATAGLQRLGLLDEAAERFDLDRFLPAPGQAALAVQVRASGDAVGLVAELDHAPTRWATAAELELLRIFEPDSHVAVAAYAEAYEDQIVLRSRLLSLDGARVVDVTVTGSDAVDLAHQAAARLR